MRVDTADQIPPAELAQVAAIASVASMEVDQLLPGLKRDWLLWIRLGKDVIPETGELGISLRPGLVEWIVDPDSTGGVLEVADRHLRNTVYHELHHQVRGWVMRGGRPARSIMDAVVAEGLATVFARDQVGQAVPWADYPSEVDDWVKELRSQGPGADYRQWMFRHQDGRRWIGYRAGAYIVDQAIAKSGRSAASLVSESTDRVLALGGVGSGGRSQSP